MLDRRRRQVQLCVQQYLVSRGRTYLLSGRTGVRSDGSVTEAQSSEGWTVDITPPLSPTYVDDVYTPAFGEVRWESEERDDASGFSHYEIALGTLPGFDDLSSWTPTQLPLSHQLADTHFNSLGHIYASIRSVDVAGNVSMPTSGQGYIDCPQNYIYVPKATVEAPLNQSVTPALEGRPIHDFCVAKYEMRAQGIEDATGLIYSTEYVAESRPDGLPWTRLVEPGEDGYGSGDGSVSAAYLACNQLGEGFGLIGNWEWQSIARGIESTPENWGIDTETGTPFINRGHSDRWPLRALSATSDDAPCYETENVNCADPSSPDYAQKRTHTLPNGEIIWDFAGNVSEWVMGSSGFDGNQWTSFTDPAFTSDPGWEDTRQRFGPLGDYDHSNGMGLIYNGFGNLARGGNFDTTAKGVGGSQDILNVGIYSGGHNNWRSSPMHGFRCIYFIP